MKVAIIAIAKNEELYINEWVNYHLNLGFDNIIICDNDDELVLPSIIKDDRVIIEDYTKVQGIQPIAYTEMFVKYRSKYDWILFIDIDEFLVLENNKNIKEFISSFDDDVEVIRLNEKHYTDNNELDVKDGNYSVFKRFRLTTHTDLDFYVKSIIKTTANIEEENLKVYGHGIYQRRLKSVDAFGNNCSNSHQTVRNIIFQNAWINHYRTKTIGEYIRQKCFRGGPNKNSFRYSKWKEYFSKTNVLTDEKIKYAEELIKNIENNNKN